MSYKTLLKSVLGEVAFFQLMEFKESFDASKRQVLLKRRSFYGQFISKGDLCFDVGANVGNRTQSLVKLGARVVAVEPQEFCQRVLKARFGRKINIIRKGLSSEEGVRTLHISTKNTLASFSEDWINAVKGNRIKRYTWNSTVDVPMTTLDRLIAEYGVPEFIKIDVEGYEYEVLKGLSTPVRMISFEYTVPELTDRLAECIQLITRINPDVEFNYSVGESMEWGLQQWKRVPDFLEYTQQPHFLDPGLGDIYVRQLHMMRSL